MNEKKNTNETQGNTWVKDTFSEVSTAIDTNTQPYTHMYVGIFVGVGSTLCNNDKQVSNECLNTATYVYVSVEMVIYKEFFFLFCVLYMCVCVRIYSEERKKRV